MSHICSNKGCELEAQYVCICLSSITYCCKFRLGIHFELPCRDYAFNSILVDLGEGNKYSVLKFLAKKKSPRKGNWKRLP